ncbi:hypothetical protein [Pelagibius marinus]|uniref:hypothetical protein n=1 Tax=Pelagibius marinus TaxID=2762760 RepID=UPI0018727ACA|nr:hypothetical protein [Pelagibius marinus]
MQHRGWFDDGHWRRGHGRRRDGERGASDLIARLRDVLLETGLWAAGSLAAASLMPPVLVAPLLRELLLFSAAFVSLSALFRGEALTLRRVNRQDVAMLLLALALIAGLFVEPEAVRAFVESGAAGQAGSAGL